MNIKARKTGALPAKSLIKGETDSRSNQLDGRRSVNKRSTKSGGSTQKGHAFWLKRGRCRR